MDSTAHQNCAGKRATVTAARYHYAVVETAYAINSLILASARFLAERSSNGAT